ncbi:hypothetical protein [Actibacterium lipolyticum]|uniref:DUF4189 domain-containing protein n=1 Tax=Actibacterium lipolyticum TaxID=1524263 RepID=A0A238KKP7_9RHOB|nr:hypothetical protein [Actibacterium lipolyticum]SMX43217.1 hypothetical protein COL8621_02245 [Actibacterium lipolyticum]
MKHFLKGTKYTIAILAFLAPLSLKAEPWTVTLNNEQTKVLSELGARSGITALAISPDGAWGTAWGWNTMAKSTAQALSNCREHVKMGKRDCVVYASNGKRILPDTIDIKRVQQRYKAINGKKAASFFGLAPIEFTGSRNEALQEFEFTKSDGQAWRTIPKSRALKRQLTGRGLVSAGKDGWAIFLTEDHAFHDSKVGRSKFEQWAISENGLLCMFFGKYENGKSRSTACMVIDEISRGEMRYNWAANGDNRARRGFIVAGDPGKNSVK